jgi:DNA-binding CsgD family transcriptional regulator
MPRRIAYSHVLTQRESEVLARLSDDLTAKEIAAQLRSTYETVRSHLESIYDKLGVAGRTGAARCWLISESSQDVTP